MKTKISPSKQRSFRRSAEQRSYASDRQQVERRKLKKQRSAKLEEVLEGQTTIFDYLKEINDGKFY